METDGLLISTFKIFILGYDIALNLQYNKM